MTENSLFENLNLSDARSENETREEYKLRLKRNREIMQLYKGLGREGFEQHFPNGITYDMFKSPDSAADEDLYHKKNK